MDLWLPPQTHVDKFIPKNKFYENAVVPSVLKREFIDQIQKITRLYKLAEETIWINKTETVEEIQIFSLQLKQKVIPKKVLKIIDKSIPYPILYIFTYQQDIAFGITLKDDTTKLYYFSEWNQKISFNFNAQNLEVVYQQFVRAFILPEEDTSASFEEIVSRDKQRKSLEKEIAILQNKIKNEKQFNKQVALNQELLTKKKQLQHI